MIVRTAGPDDLDVLAVMGERMRAESVTRFPRVEPERLARTLQLARDMPALFWFGLAERGGKPLGLLNAMVGDYAFSSERRGLVDTLYVLPEHRGGPAAVRLVRAYLAWAEGSGAKVHYAGDSAGIELERTGRFLARMGFRPAGTLYIAGG